MKRYEKESLFKNFLVFFSLLELLLVLLFLQIYHNAKDTYHQELLHTMQLCSYSLSCEQYMVDFAVQNQYELNRLYENEMGVDAYFYLPQSEKYDMRLHYGLEAYENDISDIVEQTLYQFLGITLLLLGLAIAFTLYSLKPIRQALQLNDEFVKDILHDFNTPITAMRLNISMFHKAKGEDANIQRVSHSINTLLLLQENLKAFLHQSVSQQESIEVVSIIKERLSLIASIYPKIRMQYNGLEHFTTQSNRDLLIRILDNLLSNAAKYNKPNGLVVATVQQGIITIEDTGKGIQDVDKVLQRYYTEQERGLGLGLHIVHKLTQELGIQLKISSQLKTGTTVTLIFPESES